MPNAFGAWEPGDPPRLFDEATHCASCGEELPARVHYVLVRVIRERPIVPEGKALIDLLTDIKDGEIPVERTSYVLAGVPVCCRQCGEAGATQIAVMAEGPAQMTAAVIDHRPTPEDLGPQPL